MSTDRPRHQRPTHRHGGRSRIAPRRYQRVEDRHRRDADRDHAVPGLLDDQRLVHPPTEMRKSPPNWFPLRPHLRRLRAVLHEQLPYLATSLLIGLGTVVLTAGPRRPGRLLAGQTAAARRCRV